MVLWGKLEAAIEVKPPADKFYNNWKHQVNHHRPNIFPGGIRGVEIHEGDWESHGHGSIKIWNYNIGDEIGVFKEKVEFEDENKSLTLNRIEGTLFDRCKSFKIVYQFTRKDQGSSVANFSIEYEKSNADVHGSDDEYRQES